MKVKIGTRIYDANDQPIMLILDQQDKANITNMAPEATKYCAYPENFDETEIKTWMKTND
jgi:hypothetical protein